MAIDNDNLFLRRHTTSDCMEISTDKTYKKIEYKAPNGTVYNFGFDQPDGEDKGTMYLLPFSRTIHPMNRHFLERLCIFVADDGTFVMEMRKDEENCNISFIITKSEG